MTLDHNTAYVAICASVLVSKLWCKLNSISCQQVTNLLLPFKTIV